MKKVIKRLKRVTPSYRRRRRTRRRAPSAKSDVEMNSVDFDNKTVISDSAARGESQTAQTSNSRQVRFDGVS